MIKRTIAALAFAAAVLGSCTDKPAGNGADSASGDKSKTGITAPDTAGHLQGSSHSGIYNGDSIERYDNGVIKIKGTMGGGKRQGQWVAFFPNGSVQSECQYFNDTAHGRSTVYHEDGSKYWDGFYNMGRQVGKWKYWDAQGHVVEKNYGGTMPSLK